MTHIRILKPLWLFNNSLPYLLALLFLCSIPTVLAQENRYFPQEQLVLPSCDGSKDLPDCTYASIEKKVLALLGNNKKKLKKIENDTLRCRATLVVDVNGNIDKDKSIFSIGSKKVKLKLEKKFKDLFFGLSFTKVLYHKQKDLSKHFLYFDYAIGKKGKEMTMNLVPNKKPYTGGVIEEIPIFPGCEGLDEQNTLLCFQKKIQNHIKNTFQYPKQALDAGIQGEVAVIFVITKEGSITKIRTRGPHELLENEAVRIIKLLPKITPAKQNGVPGKIPFSIPIFFRL